MYKKLPDEVVEIQRKAEERLYDIRNPSWPGSEDKFVEEIAELDKKLEPVCCSELLLPQMLSVKLKSASAITMKHIFDARDIKWNLFYMIGEIAQARGHCDRAKFWTSICNVAF